MVALKRLFVGVLIGIIFLTGCSGTGGGNAPQVTSQPSAAAAQAVTPSLTLSSAGNGAQDAAAQAAAVQTQKAEPTQTPAPILTPTPHPCDSSDLLPEVHTNDASGAIAFTVKLSNSGNTSCFLDGAPKVQLVNQQGFPLNLTAVATCYRCDASSASTPTPTDQSAATPAGTAEVSATPAASVTNTPGASVTLNPGDTTNLMLVWKNFCDPFPTGGVMIRIQVSGGGNMDLNTDAGIGGRCDTPDQPSTLEVSQFYQ